MQSLGREGDRGRGEWRPCCRLLILAAVASRDVERHLGAEVARGAEHDAARSDVAIQVLVPGDGVPHHHLLAGGPVVDDTCAPGAGEDDGGEGEHTGDDAGDLGASRAHERSLSLVEMSYEDEGKIEP